MNELVFLTNELINPSVQRKMKLPLTFIGYGIIRGRMYFFNQPRNNHAKGGSFVYTATDYVGANRSRVVYGGLFVCSDYEFYSRTLDSYHTCSMSTLLRNHTLDLQHRQNIDVIPIYFDTLDDLYSLKYYEGVETIKASAYIANPNHPKIMRNVKIVQFNSYRIQSGIDKKNFEELFLEVN